jgi:hypothetical protein
LPLTDSFRPLHGQQAGGTLTRGLRNRAVRNWVRRVAALVVSGSLAACAGLSNVPPQPNDKPWFVGYQDDAIAGKAMVALVPFNWNVNPISTEISTGELRLICFKRKPLVWIGFNFKIGSNQNAALTYRVDERPPVDAKARFLRNYSTVVIEDASEVRRFLAELAPASKLSIVIASLTADNTNISINVRGAAAAIDAIVAQCPLPPTDASKQV